MSKVEDFLSKADELEIVEAIRIAEKNTSGEIRVHIEKKTSLIPIERAKEVFLKLKMNHTKFENGVLIYVAVASKSFAIFGGKGIDAVVPENFWNSTRDIIASHFKKGNFKQGLIDGIENAGEQLKKHFPWDEDDTNELSNEISIG
jgi:uncharacterized membrane protein